jgi:hypothetical protein
MTVRELIAALQALPPEAQDYPVRRYCDWVVEQASVEWDAPPGKGRTFFVSLG